jgi:NitT/TauT family transport system ATP-binding protein
VTSPRGPVAVEPVPPDAFISIEGVGKSYPTRDGPLLAVDGLALAVARGEFVALLGPSGCGKSTLLLMLAGLLRRSAGSIRIDGRPVDSPYTDVGIVFQDPVLLDWRNVIDNLLLQAEIRGLDRVAMRGRALALLARVGLSGFEQGHPWELSGGMRQRVSLCRALVHDPSLLLMDEPFGSLDALTRDQLNLDLQDIWLARPKTVLFITHSIAEAVFLADRVVVMSPRPGRIAAEFPVDLPRPRTLGLRETPAFGRHTAQIRALFEGWGVLRERPGAAVEEGTR